MYSFNSTTCSILICINIRELFDNRNFKSSDTEELTIFFRSIANFLALDEGLFYFNRSMKIKESEDIIGFIVEVHHEDFLVRKVTKTFYAKDLQWLFKSYI
eukprot:snap_masked-scaffold_32-processed-gene-0.26-mRNA-1 protein AED:1.00 eAED:1.00 QI:0/0/0/0/1/1/2/0/100